MKKMISLLLILAAALILAAPATAEVREGAFTVFPFIGGYTFDGIQHLETNVATGVALGYNLTRNWGVEGRFTWVPLQATQGNVPGDYSLFNFHGDVLYHFMPESRLVPYVALGAGWSRTEWPTGDNDDAILVYGGGVKYSINDWLGLRGDIRQLFSFHSDASGATAYWNNFEYTFGLDFQFGGAKPGTPAVKAETLEAPVQAPPAQAQMPAPQAPPTQIQAPAPQASPQQIQAPAAQAPLTHIQMPAPQAPPPQAEMPAPSPAAPAPKPASAPAAAPVPKPAQVPAPTAAGQTSWRAKEGATKLPEGTIVLTGMDITPEGLEMVFSRGFYYEIHAPTKPSRLEIDVHGAVNGLDVDTVTVNRIGIATVRLESKGDILRFVLYPAAGYALPSRIDVTNNFLGLLIHKASPAAVK